MGLSIIVTGATGLVGAEVIREAINDPAIEKITAISRKPLPVTNPKLTVILHPDFSNYEPLQSVFQTHDVCVWALGVSQFQVSKEEYVRITYDYILAAAKAMLQSNPSLHLMFVSGEGADQTEQSGRLFAKIKGRAEKDLLALPFKKLTILRPAGIRPIHKNPNAPLLYKLLNPIYPALEFMFPKHVIKSTDLAKAILLVLQNRSRTGTCTIHNQELRKLAKSLG